MKTKQMLALLLALCLLPAVCLAESEEPVPFVPFEAETIEGEAISSDIYAQADYTIVMYSATWCSACHQCTPELIAFLDAYNAQGGATVQAVSVMTDTRSYETGELEEDVVEDAKTLKESLEIPYPVLIPDDNLFAVMSIISYFPTFFVVDSDGNIAYATYGGLAQGEWETVFEELTAV